MPPVLPPYLRRALATSWHQTLTWLQHPVLVGSAIVTLGVMAGQQLGLWQSWELVTFDRMMQVRGSRDPDPRLLVVTITEEDLQRYSFPINDQTLAQLLAELQRYQPQSIGLDLFRDQPKPPGYDALREQLAQPNLVAIYKVGSEENPLGIPRPPQVSENRSGFNDVVTDADGVIRRSWLYGGTETEHLYSFALTLSQRYLKAQGLPAPDWIRSERVAWGKAVFTPLRSDSGGYQTIDDSGFQILLNYRASQKVARQVTLTEVLEQKLDPAWVQDKIVLIGTTAPSARDVFFTPYSSAERQIPTMPGVLIHAQMVSQLLDAVLGDRPLFRFWPLGGEVLWVFGWSLVGGAIAWQFRHPLRLSLVTGVGLLAVLASGFGLFTQVVWVPVVAPAIALLLAEAGVLVYTTYQIQQEQKQVMLLAQNQEQTITLLRTLLVDHTQPFSDITRPNNLTTTSQSTYLPSDLLEEALSIQEVKSDSLQDPVVDRPRTEFVLSNRYRLLKILGTGGFAVTYLAEDIQRPGNPLCVVKHLLPARSDDRFLQTARRLFKTEAEILERLGRHAQIPYLLASFEENGKFYLVEEYIQGVSLSDEFASGKPFSDAQTLGLLTDMLDVLVFIHSYHVIHRDIKPSNIIRREADGQLVLIDFGAVKQMQPDLLNQENATVAIGTRGYAPPEQLVGHPSFNSDLYSLGMVTIQAVTGVLPQQLETDPEDGTVRWRHLTSLRPDLAGVIEKMVRYYFNERYQTAADALRDLKQLSHSLSA